VQVEALQETVQALNELYGVRDQRRWPRFTVNAAQRASIERVRGIVAADVPPRDTPLPEAALRQLLQSGSQYLGTGTLGSYSADRVSIPEGVGIACPLVEMLEHGEREMLENFESTMKLQGDELASVLGLEAPPAHTDPALKRSPERYLHFVRLLFLSGIVAFTKTPKCVIGVFPALKRMASLGWCGTPEEPTDRLRSPLERYLGSAESISRIELQEGEDLFVAQEDVKDYVLQTRYI